MISNANPAAISLKNGRTKYGFLLNFSEETNTNYEFLCNSKIKHSESHKSEDFYNEDLIERISVDEILSIDAYLK